jgi:putative transposase
LGEKKGGETKNSLRLRGFDYASEGAYFVTLIVHEHKCIFGKVVQGKVTHSKCGQIACEEWLRSSEVRSEIVLYDDEFIVMPNHLHGIVWINNNDGFESINPRLSKPLVRATGRLPIRDEVNSVTGPRPKSLSAFVAGYKSAVTKKINSLKGTPGYPVWMRNYHDRIVRNERELSAIRRYIHENPLKWELDRYYSSYVP